MTNKKARETKATITTDDRTEGVETVNLAAFDAELESHGPWVRAEPAKIVGRGDVQMLFRHSRTGNHVVVSVFPSDGITPPVDRLRVKLDEFTVTHGE